MRSRWYGVLALAAMSSYVPHLSAQESKTTLDTPQIQLGAYNTAPFQRLLDFDGDGDVDAAGGRVSTNFGLAVAWSLEVWQNDGSGRFEPFFVTYDTSVPAGTIASGMPIATGDLDGDGLDDIALGAGAELWLFHSTGGAAFPRTVVPLTAVARSVAIGDFDGDGRGDVALHTSSDVQVHLSAGGVLSMAHGFTPGSAERLIVMDTEGDALDDLVMVSNANVLPMAVGVQGISAGAMLQMTGATVMVDGGDIDADGDTDLVAFHLGSSSVPAHVEVMRCVGRMQWVVEPSYPGGPAEYLADIDGDGDADGVCCSGGGSGTYPHLDFESTFEISLNDDGVFRPAVEMPGLGSRSLAGAADVDGDGDVDLVAGRCVYFQRDGFPGFPKADLASIESDIEVADFDRDGDTDAWVQTTVNAGVENSALRSRGDGSFAYQPMVMAGLPAGQTALGPRVLGDFDGDGDTDVILGVWQGGTFLHEGLWRNSGGGSFHYAGACTPAGMSFFIDSINTVRNFLVGDIGDDGDVDVIMRATPHLSTSAWGRHDVYLNNGGGFFSKFTSDTTYQAHALRDFDNDGIVDLLVSKPVSPGGVAIQRGQPGDAAPFAAVQTIANLALGKSSWVDLADFDGDGRLDIGTIKYQPETPSGPDWFARVYLNRTTPGGAFTFLETEVTGDGSGSNDARVLGVDVNHDGRTDVVFGPFDSDRAWKVYLQKANAGANLGHSAFEPGVEVVLTGVLADDADGDGDLDLLGTYLARNHAVSGQSSREQYGAASPGSGAVRPTLGASGPFDSGLAARLKLRGATGTAAYLAVSSSAAALGGVPFPGNTLLVDPTAPGFFAVLVPLNPGGGGVGQASIDVPYVVSPTWAGLTFYHQMFPIDPNSHGGLSSTNGLRLTYGL